jgi:ParB family chromosome partitioning protein
MGPNQGTPGLGAAARKGNVDVFFNCILRQRQRSMNPAEKRLRLKYIKIGDILVEEKSRGEGRGLKELADSLEEHGLLQPVRVSRDANGRYVLVSGYRRFLAAQRLAEGEGGLGDALPCIVVENGDPVITRAVENFQREALSPVEVYRLLVQLRGKNRSCAEVAALMGLSVGRTKNLYVAVRELQANRALEKVFSNAGVTLEDVAITAGLEDGLRFPLLRKRGAGDLTRRQLRQAVKDLKGGGEKQARDTRLDGPAQARWQEDEEETLNAGRIIITVNNSRAFRGLAAALWKRAESAAGKLNIELKKQ